jgi:hypothetical protein
MMISTEDLRAAVSRGIVTEAQSAQLIALSSARQSAVAGVSAAEEPFVLFKGFNEIFVVVGLTILFMGWIGVAVLFGLNMKAPAGGTTAFLALVTLAGLAGVGRYFTLTRRMIAPSIALSIMSALAATVLGVALAGIGDYALVITGLVVLAVMSLHYAIFRVPFSAAIIAGAAFFTVWAVALATGFLPATATGMLFLRESPALSLLTFCFGLATFAVAMRLDMSDPMRVSTRSATAFWLHVTAAPAIVNTVALNLLGQPGALPQALLLGFLFLIAVVAIVIDRRSFLVSGAGYSVVLASTLFSGSAALAILILGAVLVALGAMWERLRARLMNALPDFPGKTNLPPYGNAQ